MSGEIASAFVRIRPNLSGFKSEAEHGIKSALRSVGGNVPGLTRANEQLALFSGYQRKAAESAVVSSRVVRSAREQEARATVASTLVERRALGETLVQYRRLAASAKLSAESRQIANVKAAETAGLLGVPLSRTEHQARATRNEFGKLERGAVAGSGVFKGLGRNIAYSSGAFIGAYGLVGAIKKAISAQGDLLNQETRTKTVFRGSATAIETWSKTAVRALGFSRSSALETADSFGTIFTAAGVAPGRAAKFSEDLAKVSSAISLARGEEDPARATKALQVALAGRGRALRQYGIILDDTSLKAKAAELGLVKSTVDPDKLRIAQQKLSAAATQLALDRADPKTSPLKLQKDVIAVEQAQAGLKKTLAGTTSEVSRQAKAEAAHAIIMEQGKRFVDRYQASLGAAAGRSRKFHESLAEVEEELGHELYPSFRRIEGSITSYVLSLAEGGKRHREFIRAIHGIASAARFAYEIFRTGTRIVGGFTHAVGGLGNALKLLVGLWTVSKIVAWTSAITNSRTALFLLGQRSSTTRSKVLRDAEYMAGGFGGATGKVAKLRAALAGLPQVIGPITVLIALSVVGGSTVRKFVADHLGFGSLARDRRADAGGLRVGKQKNLEGLGFTYLGQGVYLDPKTGDFWWDNKNGVAQSGSAPPAEARPSKSAEDVNRFHAGTPSEKAKTKKDAAADGTGVGNSFGDAVAFALRAKRKKIRDELAQVSKDLADARATAAQQISAAVAEAQKAEREAILSAKSNLNSLGSSLADKLDQFLEAKGKHDETKLSGPLARRLRALERLIHTGKATPALIREAQRVEHELDAQKDQSQKKRQDTQRRLADLTDELNTGKISLARFNREVTRLLRREGISYKAAGKTLGISFADGFREALKELREQAAAIANTPARLRRLGTGFDQEVIRPAQVIREQAKNIAQTEREQRKRIGELVTKQEALLKEAKAVGLTAKQQRGAIIGELKKGNGHREKASRERPKKEHDKPRADLTDTLLKRVVAVGYDELAATRKQNDILSAADGAAREQRAAMVHAERHQVRLLERMVRQGTRQNELLVGVAHGLRGHRRRGDGHKNDRDASTAAIETAFNNLLGR